MKGNRDLPEKPEALRSSPRIYSLREITVSYEGQNQEIVVKPPNLSARGMFINTGRTFPEGAVLNLRFTLVLTGAEVRTRCEVRYSQPGVGIGVEFIGLPAEAMKMIEREIALSSGTLTLRRARKKRGKGVSQNARSSRSS
jgi:PilZ domain